MDEPLQNSIVAALGQREVAAFDLVYARFHRKLYSFLCRMTGRRDVAEDLSQELWYRFAKSVVQFESEAEVSAWLYTVARNLTHSHQRWLRIHFDRLWQIFQSSDRTAASPFELIATNEAEGEVEYALAALRPADREVLLLVAVDGFTPAHAARVLNIRPDAFRQRLTRARARFETKLRIPRSQAALGETP